MLLLTRHVGLCVTGRQVDLLKVDVERAELDVLSGISPDDWHKIQQVVLEVHDIDGRLQVVQSLLATAGFHNVVSEQDASLVGTSLYNVYATRNRPSMPLPAAAAAAQGVVAQRGLVTSV